VYNAGMSERHKPIERGPQGIQIARFVGLFESGGFMGFKGTFEAGEFWPIISINSHKTELPVYLHQMYGGWLSSDSTNWSLYDKDPWVVASLVLPMAPLAVRRQGYIETLNSFLAARSLDEKQMIVGDYREQDTYAGVTADDYRELVRDEVVLAAVFDNRASIFPLTPYSNKKPAISMTSVNQALLQAIADEYSTRELVTASPVGTKIRVGEKRGITSRVSYQWMVTHEQAYQVLDKVAKHLVIPPYEGWDYRPMSLQTMERDGNLDFIFYTVERELEELDRGLREQLSSNADLAEMLRRELGSEVSITAIERYMTFLPEDLRNRRVTIIRSDTAQRVNRKRWGGK
jgi:hypothetical protein